MLWRVFVAGGLTVTSALHAELTYGGVALPPSTNGHSIIAHKIVASDEPLGKCLDGTDPAIYFFKGADSSRFTIHHEGGGWCSSIQACADRAKTDLGSSSAYPDTYNLQGLVDHWGAWYLSDEPEVNPLMFSWSKILFRYCDGGSWTGSNSTVTLGPRGQALHFAGHNVLRAGIKAMLNKAGMREAAAVVVNGGSAGALAVYHHADEYATAVPKADVVALPDGGFFVAYGAYPAQMRWVYEQMNSTAGLNARCVESHASEEWKCILAQIAAPHILTPVFALQGRFDSDQTANILGSHEVDLVNEYGHNLTRLLQSSVLDTRVGNAAFVDSCHHHTGGWARLRAPLGASGSSQAEAFAAWFFSRKSKVWLQDKPFPCPDCCPCACGQHGGCTSCCECTIPLKSEIV